MEIVWFGDVEKTRKNLPEDHVWQDYISFEENLNIGEEIKSKRLCLHI
jgi:hypothetical protein